MRHLTQSAPPTALSFINRTDQANGNSAMTDHDDGSGGTNRHFNGTPNLSS